MYDSPRQTVIVRWYLRNTFVMACLLSCCFVAEGLAAPTLMNISLRGLQAGATTKVVITGTGFGANPRVLIDAPILKQSAKLLAPTRLEVELQLAADANVGVYQLRLATDSGVSNPLAIGIDALPQIGFAERVPSLPISMTGSLSGSQILKTSFAGKKGQRVVVEVESQRLGAALKPIARIIDPRGTQLAFSAGDIDLLGDARCEAVLPSDGQYTIVLHDVIYRGANPGHFRLKIGDWKYPRTALPMGVQAGKNVSLQMTGADVGKIEIDAKNWIPGGIRHAPMPSNSGRVGAPPRIMVTDATEVIETKTENGKLQAMPTVPVGVSGRLAEGQTEDRFAIPVQAGKRLRFEVFAQRLGSPLDGVLIIRGEKGNELARNDDQNSTTDPRVDFTVPAGAKQLIVALQDLRRRSGDAFVYRIGVRDLSLPDFTLTVDQDRLNIPARGVKMIRVEVARVAYDGPIRLELPGLPSGLSVSGNRIEAGATFTLMTLVSTSDAAFADTLEVRGIAEQVKPPLVRIASAKNAAGQASLQPWLARQVALGSAPADPIRVAWSDDEAELKTHLGGEHEIKVAIQRNPGVKGNIRLKLAATQVIPKKNIKQKNKQVSVDDLDRAIRLASNVMVKEGENEASAKLLIPADLPDRVWGVVMIAELVSPKTKKVVATATSSTRRLTRVQPIRLEYAGPNKIEAKAGGGDTAEVSGTIHRVDGFSKPVVVTLEGLPKGYAAPSLTVAANASSFKLPIRFAPKAKPATLKNIRLLGRYQPNPKVAALAVRTNAAQLEIKVVAGTPVPPPAKTDPSKKDPAKKDPAKKDPAKKDM